MAMGRLAPLMRIKAASHQQLDLGPGDGVGAEPESAVDFTALVTSDGNPEGKDETWVHAHLGDYLLGYDLDPESFKGLLKQQAALGASLPANDPELAIDWPLAGEPRVSAKDAQGTAFRDAEVFP